jgi:hypothetical protein
LKDCICKGKNLLLCSTTLASALAESLTVEELNELAAFLVTLADSLSLIIVNCSVE